MGIRAGDIELVMAKTEVGAVLDAVLAMICGHSIAISWWFLKALQQMCVSVIDTQSLPLKYP